MRARHVVPLPYGRAIALVAIYQDDVPYGYGTAVPINFASNQH